MLIIWIVLIKYVVFVCLFWVWGATSDDTQDLLLMLSQESFLVGLRIPYGMPGIKLKLAVWEASTLICCFFALRFFFNFYF